MRVPLLFKSKPVFGLDVGRSTVKIAQLSQVQGQTRVVGYGYAKFDPAATKQGLIIKPELIAEAVRPVLKRIAIGKLTTNRVITSVPLAQTYTRILDLPNLTQKDLAEAVKLEAEQYIPIPSEELYIEYAPLSHSETGDKPTNSVLMVAVPKQIITSIIALLGQMNLEVAAVEPDMFSNLRSINFSCPASNTAQIIIDFGANSSDLTIYDTTFRLTSTLPKGGDHITERISQALGVSLEQANKVKVRYGIGKSQWQAKLAVALEPVLSAFAAEVQKMMRYYHDHANARASITAIVVVGGGANMPGLSDFLTHLTGVPVRVCDPWKNIQVKPLQPPHSTETTIYTTAVGLALREFQP